MERTEDQALVEGICRGDRQAFDQLVVQYQGQVYFTALRMLHNHEDALDVSQEVFIKVWQQIRTLKKGGKVYSWLYRITINASLDRIRWKKRHSMLPLSDADVITIPEWRYETNPRELLREALWKRQVEKALESLPAKQKVVFVLRHYQNLKLREIAEIINRPLGTVKATLHHAIQNLRRQLPLEEALPLGDTTIYHGVARKAEDI